jgi:hypothetical protein
MMGRTSWNLCFLFLLIPLSVLACRERKAPELSVRTPEQTEPTQDLNPNTQPPSGEKPDQDKDSPGVTQKTVITIDNIVNPNGLQWAVALVTIQDANSGVIRFAETIRNPSAATGFTVPYGSYFITLEFFADAAKTQSLAKSCPADQKRMHQVSGDTYNAVLMVCTVSNTDPDSSDVVIRPVVI